MKIEQRPVAGVVPTEPVASEADQAPVTGATDARRKAAPGRPATNRMLNGRVAKRALVGRPMPSDRMQHTLLPKILALPVFAADALSSVAYCVESSLLVLIGGAGLAAAHLVIPIQIGIALLMAIVVASYRQTVHAYPTGGGSYIVSKDNLGTPPGLVAAAALLTDYVLTVSVSVASGVLAIVSISPSTLGPYKVPMSLAFVVFIALANLRGVRESGMLFAFPVYGFIASMFILIMVGLVRCIGGCPVITNVPSPIPAGVGAVSVLLVLHAFASGSSALTGVEAISNGIRAFKRPQAKNAAQTLLALGALGIFMILGTAVLAHGMGARPSTSVSVLSEIARTVFPGGGTGALMFYLIQAFTFAVLIFAANTSYQDFPRLAAILARDRFVPRQFENLGDRLVYSNGVVVLTVLASALIVVFGANVDRLIQLYVVGVFTAFTLSQSGMVRHWIVQGRTGGPAAGGWRRRAIVNGIGAVATGLVTVDVIYTKFSHGAWIVIIAVPLIVAFFYGVSRHYRSVARQMRTGAPSADAPASSTTVMVIGALDAGAARALGYVRALSGDDFQAVHVQRPYDPADLAEQWRTFARCDVPMLFLSGRSVAGAVVEFVRSVPRGDGHFVNVVVPEVLRSRSLRSALRNWGPFTLKLRLVREPDVVVTSVPVLAGDQTVRPSSPRRSEAVVLVSAVNDVTVRAVNVARSLHVREPRALFVALDQSEVGPVFEDWLARRIPVELDIVGAPFRELGPPVLGEVRRLTADPGATVTVVLPELVPGRWRYLLLHNQRATYLKRLLLFEPGVVLSSVPYVLR
jgi:amino acid transporter